MSNDKPLSENAFPDNSPERDDPMVAAEYALGLLEGEELLKARGRMVNDPEFAWRRGWWDDWFVPLSDEVAGAEPSAHVWQAISDQVADQKPRSRPQAHPTAQPQSAPAAGGAANVAGLPASNNVIDLQARVRRWQWIAGAASVAAALALALFITAPGAQPIAPDAPQIASRSGDPLVAQVPIGETGLRLDVTFIPETEEMLIGAIGLTPDGVHDHELWLVPLRRVRSAITRRGAARRGAPHAFARYHCREDG